MPRPMVSVENLTYYRDHIQEAIRKDGVVCLECGTVCWRVGKHVEVHGLTAATYRAKWGYGPGTRLALAIPPEGRRRPPARVPPPRPGSGPELGDLRQQIP